MEENEIVAVETAKNICVYIIVNAENSIDVKREREREKELEGGKEDVQNRSL